MAGSSAHARRHRGTVLHPWRIRESRAAAGGSAEGYRPGRPMVMVRLGAGAAGAGQVPQSDGARQVRRRVREGRDAEA